MPDARPYRVWSIAEAKARLSEILRHAEAEGPQRIGVRRAYIVVPARAWDAANMPSRKPLGLWLVDNMPRGTNLDVPDGRRSRREIPFLEKAVE